MVMKKILKFYDVFLRLLACGSTSETLHEHERNPSAFPVNCSQAFEERGISIHEMIRETRGAWNFTLKRQFQTHLYKTSFCLFLLPNSHGLPQLNSLSQPWMDERLSNVSPILCNALKITFAVSWNYLCGFSALSTLSLHCGMRLAEFIWLWKPIDGVL